MQSRYPTSYRPRNSNNSGGYRATGPRAQRTSKDLEESDWTIILALIKEDLKYRTRDKLIVQMLFQNGNKSLSEKAICELAKVSFFKTGQCQVLNAVFNRHKLPYRLGIDPDEPRNNPHYKIFVVRGGRQ